MALIVASLVSTASFAGAQAPAGGPPADRHGMGGGMERGRGERGERGERWGALRGIKLSDAEQAKVKEIHAKYAAEGQTLRESLKPVMEEARSLRQKGDTAGLRALWDRNKASRDQMQALRVRQQVEVRTALSPENQKLFDANVQEMAARRAEWEKNGKGGKHGGRHGEFHGRGAGKVG
jgi:Spy/CpxP family protein refolding chaperone